MKSTGLLVVLRGNSASGKSTVAGLVQAQFDHGRCAIISQDEVRREILNDRDLPGAINIDMIEAMAKWCLGRGLIVIVEGILHASRYQRMLEELASYAAAALFYSWDLTFEETVRRHEGRAKFGEFTAAKMSDWYHGWQPLNFVTETRLDASVSADEAARRISSSVNSLTSRVS